MLSPEATERVRRRVGTTLSAKYRLDALIGVGGMAAVYAATHRNGSRSAVKVLHAELSRAPEIRARFLREGYVANKVDHPGAIRVIDDDVDADGCAFLVMELLEGETLEARWESAGSKLSLEETLAFVDAILDVLDSAHAHGVIHRDIKPENVFVTKAGIVKLMDFGIARLHEGVSVTKSGDLLGTPAFIAPEQANGRAREIDHRTDVWAVGATAFTLLTGAFVHDATTAPLMLIYAATQPARSIATVAPDVPEDIAHVIDVALAFDREGRWQSASAMQTALRNARERSARNTMPSARPPAQERTSATTVKLGSMGDGEIVPEWSPFGPAGIKDE